MARFRQPGIHFPFAFNPIFPGALEVRVKVIIDRYAAIVVEPIGIERPIVGVACVTVKVATDEVTTAVFPLKVLVTITLY